MRQRIFTRGEVVVVRAYGGHLLTRRVWADAGRGVLVCSEGSYQDALRLGLEPLYSGFPKEDVEAVLVDQVNAP